MTRCRTTLTLACILTFSIWMSVGFGNQVSHNASNEANSEKPEFALPQKHKTTLTRSEQQGRDLYIYYCALCHGKTGKGDGFNAYNMKTAPAKHSDQKRMSSLSDKQIQTIIRKGGPGLGWIVSSDALLGSSSDGTPNCRSDGLYPRAAKAERPIRVGAHERSMDKARHDGTAITSGPAPVLGESIRQLIKTPAYPNRSTALYHPLKRGISPEAHIPF